MSQAHLTTLSQFKRHSGQCTWVGASNSMSDITVSLITGKGLSQAPIQ